MTTEYNNKLIDLWSREVQFLLGIFKIPFEAGSFLLSKCSVQEIEFSNRNFSFVFCYVYERYNSPIQYMSLGAIDVRTKNKSILLDDLVRLVDKNFDVKEFIRGNSLKSISPEGSYCILIEKYMMNAIVKGEIFWE